MTRNKIVIKSGVKMTEKMCSTLKESQETLLINPIALMEENLIAGYLIKGKRGKFAKLFSFFFWGGSSCDVIIKRKPVSLGDGEQTQVPCELTHAGCKPHIEILKKEPVKLEENYMK